VTTIRPERRAGHRISMRVCGIRIWVFRCRGPREEVDRTCDEGGCRIRARGSLLVELPRGESQRAGARGRPGQHRWPPVLSPQWPFYRAPGRGVPTVAIRQGLLRAARPRPDVHSVLEDTAERVHDGVDFR
jgi:hypothetical protein